jgi:hypothetical protein
MKKRYLPLFVFIALLTISLQFAQTDEPVSLPKAFIDGTGPGWVELGKDDFVNDVNCDPETWIWKEDILLCSGKPIGVMRSKKTYTNFEYVIQWRHLRPGGNSGTFVWVDGKAFEGLKPNQLPKWGIEVQMLDHGYTENYIRQHNKKPDWFSTNGDIFAVGNSKLNPFPPLSPNGKRSFPSKNLSKGHGEWNHYYVRCINGEIRLWVNGEEVSGGNNAEPATGYLCLESEGAPIEFKHIRIRELP